MKIGFFGGTFNPIHLGHLNLAVEILERFNLDEIWFSVTGLSPFKQKHIAIDICHRQEMVRLSIEKFPKFKLLEIEMDQENPSFTFDTISAIKHLHPNFEFYLCLGEDAAKELPLWHRYEELIVLAPPLVAARNSDHITLENKMSIIATRRMDISSTDVRQRLKKGKVCGHLVPTKVLDYIAMHKLYS